VFRPAGIADISCAADRKLYLGQLTGRNGAVIDSCMCTVSRAPSSYTGEDTAELHCHGSPVVLREGLLALFAAGARMAEPGEFTKRALLNGKMDLTQAEAVIDLIEAETPLAARTAAGQLGGAIRDKIGRIYSALVDIMAHFHAVIDYPDEDIEDFELANYLGTLNGAGAELDRLSATYERGAIIKNGVPAAIIGRPNVGKSSLLNALLGYDRAIVTEIAGTTRDTLEEKVRIGDLLLRLTDTAGIRQARDPIETLGVLRAKAAADSSSLLLAVFDGSEAFSPDDRAIASAALGAGHRIAVVNKSDLTQKLDLAKLGRDFDALINVSAKTGDGLGALEKAIAALFPLGDDISGGEMLTNLRQEEAVRSAREHIALAGAALEDGVTPDAVLSEVEMAIRSLGEVTGRTARDDVIERVFSRFCVGK